MPNTRSFCLLVTSFILAAVSAGCGSSDESVSPERWVLVMADEFDGEEGMPPDSSMWTYDIGGDGWGNNQLEFNTDRIENVSLDGQGNLRIRAIEESFMDNDYTSGRIKTQGLFEQQYGRFEARIRLPEGGGLWPAFWMLGANIDEVPWPGCGEIDVMEFVGRDPGRMFGTLHGPGYSAADSISNDTRLPEGESFADDFHVFAIEWDPGRITFFIDSVVEDGVVQGGELYHFVRSADVGSHGDWVFNNSEFFLLLNLAVGGSLGGPVDPDTVFPADMLVDYVRVFERVP